MQSLPGNYLTDQKIEIGAYAEIWSSLNGGASSLIAGNLPVVGGTVTIDRSNAFRRSASNVTLLDPTGSLVPTVGGGGAFKPFGYEMRLYKGIKVGGAWSYAQLGVFLIGEVDVKNDSSGLQLIGTLRDRGEWISRMSFAAPWFIDQISHAPISADAAILSYLQGALYGVFGSVSVPFPYSFLTSTYNPASIYAKTGDDPWRIMSDIAVAAGLQLFFDYQGELHLSAIPTPGGASLSFLEGTPSAPHQISRVVTNQNVPNVVCVEVNGSKTNPPLKVWWWDSVGGSPSFYAASPAGGFSPLTPQTTLPPTSGQYPPTIQKYQSTIPGDAAQAQATANALGQVAAGASEKATFAVRDYPGLDVDDVVDVSRAVAGVSGATPYVIDAVQIGLDVQSGTQFTGRPTAWV